MVRWIRRAPPPRPSPPGTASARIRRTCSSPAARALGIPARYASGHLYRPGDESTQPATHAWAEAWLGDYGWIGFDPVNDHCPDDAYVRVAVGLDYRDAAPLSGARIGGGEEWLRVAVRVGLSPAHGQAQAQTQD